MGHKRPKSTSTGADQERAETSHHYLGLCRDKAADVKVPKIEDNRSISQKVYILAAVDNDQIRNQISPERLAPMNHFLLYLPARLPSTACSELIRQLFAG
jgi:hypothetical protein